MRAEPTLGVAPRPLTGGAVIAATSRVGVAVAGAIATVVLARVLGAEGWASYFVAQSLFLLLLAGSTLGAEHGVVYYVSSERWGARAAYRAALRISVCMGILGAAAGVAARLLVPSAFPGLSVGLTAVVVLGLPFALAWLYVSFIALATDRYEVSMSVPVVQALLVLALAAPAAVIFGLRGAVVGSTLATIAVGVAAVGWGGRRLPASGRSEPGQVRRAISFGIKGYVANALQLLNYRLDVFVLSAVASATVVGAYSLAVALTSLLWLLPKALSDVLFPRVARLSAGDEDSTRDMVETKSLRHVSLVTIVSVIAFVPALELLVVPVFGAEFRPAINLGLILLPGAAAIGISAVLAATIVGRGKPEYSLYGALIVTPPTIVLYAVLIPWLGDVGAALASTLSYLGAFLLVSWFYRRATGRRVTSLLIPTRSELEDLRALPHSLLAWAGGLRR